MAFAFSPLFWSQALISEVYALNGLFVALTIYLLLWWPAPWRPDTGMEGPGRGIPSATAFLYGLGLGNHLIILLLAPAVLLFLLPRRLKLSWWRSLLPAWAVQGRHRLLSGLRAWAAVAAPLLLGLCVYLYLPLRAVHHPPINWGDPHTWRGFLWMISGRLYRHFLFALPLHYLPTRLFAWAGLLVRQFGWWGVLLGLGGWWSLWQRERKLGLFSSALFLAYSIYAIGYNTSDSQVYLIPAFLLFALWWGWGLDSLLAGLDQLIAPSQSGLRRALPLCLALAIPLPSLVGNFSSLDLSRDHSAQNYGLEALAALDPEAIVISQTDPHTFTLWYFRHAEGRRPDVVVLDGDLLRYEWYRRNTSQLYPHIALGGGKGALPSQVPALIAGNLDRYPIYLTDPDPQVQARYQLSKEGPLYRVVSRE